MSPIVLEKNTKILLNLLNCRIQTNRQCLFLKVDTNLGELLNLFSMSYSSEKYCGFCAYFKVCHHTRRNKRYGASSHFT